MKKYIRILSLAVVASAMLTSCLEEEMPTDSATGQQAAEAGLQPLSSGIMAYMNQYSTSLSWDCGFMSFPIWRDASTCDFTVNNNANDYFSYVGNCNYLGANDVPFNSFRRYYYVAAKADIVIAAAGDNVSAADAPYLANAYAYRAWAYMELSQWFEYFYTGFANLDNEATTNGVYGLTVPIVTEKTTEAEARNNPRAPFYTMYRFILSDLDKALTLVNKYGDHKGDYTMACKGVINGLLARTWLLLGSRFDLENPANPDYLAEALEHEDDPNIEYPKLGILTAGECFAKAAQYARLAMQGYTPLTESQWFDPKNGFNSPNNAWMWAITIDASNSLASWCTWQSFPSYMSPEAEYGVSTSSYGAYRCINAAMFEEIPDGDWRKTTWIDPADLVEVGETSDEITENLQKIFEDKYARGTTMTFAEWRKFAPYASFKFHPGGGNRTESTAGNVISFPLMRVEEMYFIEAEAVGRSEGEAAGRQLLEAFINNYRWSSDAPKAYASTGSGISGFIDDLFLQKRIELWGEGHAMWDYRRLQKQMVRGYDGTNWPARYRYNSNPQAVAPWTTGAIPQSSKDLNRALILNPNASHEVAGYYQWTASN